MTFGITSGLPLKIFSPPTLIKLIKIGFGVRQILKRTRPDQPRPDRVIDEYLTRMAKQIGIDWTLRFLPRVVTNLISVGLSADELYEHRNFRKYLHRMQCSTPTNLLWSGGYMGASAAYHSIMSTPDEEPLSDKLDTLFSERLAVFPGITDERVLKRIKATAIEFEKKFQIKNLKSLTNVQRLIITHIYLMRFQRQDFSITMIGDQFVNTQGTLDHLRNLVREKLESWKNDDFVSLYLAKLRTAPISENSGELESTDPVHQNRESLKEQAKTIDTEKNSTGFSREKRDLTTKESSSDLIQMHKDGQLVNSANKPYKVIYMSHCRNEALASHKAFDAKDYDYFTDQQKAQIENVITKGGIIQFNYQDKIELLPQGKFKFSSRVVSAILRSANGEITEIKVEN